MWLIAGAVAIDFFMEGKSILACKDKKLKVIYFSILLIGVLFCMVEMFEMQEKLSKTVPEMYSYLRTLIGG